MAERQHFSKTEDLRQAIAKYKHLREYVSRVSQKQGMPEFKIQLDRELRNLENPNFIYPVGDPIFIHISRGDNGENIKYQVIMPELGEEEKEIYDTILDRIIEIAHTSKIPNSLEELRDILLGLYNEVVEIREKNEKPNFLHSLGKKVALTEEQFHIIQFHLIKDRLGYGRLEPLLRDIYIEDISCIGVGAIWIIHKIFGSTESTIIFEDDIDLNKYIVESSERVERPVSEATPIVDAIMPDGSRVNYIYSRKISLGGSSFTIRKFNETPISAPMLINWGTWSFEMGAFLWLCLEHGISIFVCGETASGKTTTLNAMTAFIPFDQKVYSVENTPEITLPHPIWQHLVTRESGEKTDVTMFDLLLASLRSRPDYIIVGEIRGKEANITFQAMQCIREGKVFLEDRGFIDIKQLYTELEKKFGSKKTKEKLTVTIPKGEREKLLVSKKDGRIFSSKLTNIYKMDKKELLKVVFDNGEVLQVTPKHKFIIGENKEITADEIFKSKINIRDKNISSQLVKMDWDKKEFFAFQMLENHNILKTKEYLYIEEKFRTSKRYLEIYKNFKDYFTKRSKTIPFSVFKEVYTYCNKELPFKVEVVFKGVKGSLIVEDKISNNLLISISNYVLGKKVSKKEELFITRILGFKDKTLGNYIFKFSKSQIKIIVENWEKLIIIKEREISDKLWYSLGRLVGDDSLYITKANKFKDFRWQIKNANEDEGKIYANFAKKSIPNNAISIPTTIQTNLRNNNTYTTRICNIKHSFIDYLIKNQFISLPDKVNKSKAVNKYIPFEKIGNIQAYTAGMLDSDSTIRYNKQNRSYDIKFALNINRENSSLMKDQLNFIKKLENKLFPKVLCVDFRYNSKYKKEVLSYSKFVKELGFKVRIKEYNKANGIGARVEFSSNLKQKVFAIWKKEIIPFMYRKDKIETIKSMNIKESGSSSLNTKKTSFIDIENMPVTKRKLIPELVLLARICDYNLVCDNIFYYDNAKWHLEKSKSTRIIHIEKSVTDNTYDITMEDGKYYTGGNNNFGYIYDTGHPVISTFHAGSVHSMIQRLTGEPLNIPIAFIDNLNIVLIQSAVYVNGKVERRVLSITEVIRYNDEVKKVLTKEVFHWDTVKDEHQFRGLYNSYILEQKVASHLGLKDPREIYNIMKKRAKILEKLLENKIMDYFEVVKLLKRYREEGDRSLPFKI